MTVSRAKLFGIALAIFAATVWLYWPSVHGGFLSGDDAEYLEKSVRWNGLTWSAVKWAFTSTDSYYHPVVRLSHVLDYQIWGKNPAGHHAVNVVVHAANVALVFGFVWTLLGYALLTTGERLAVAVWVALVFGIHPLQVESVAWIAGRTQLLCTTFGIGCLWAYAARSRHWLVWVLYVAALLCKPMAVSFPFVMLAMDYYPLRRYEQLGWNRLVWEKTALITLAAMASAAALLTRSEIGLITPLATLSLSDRIFLSFESLTFYPFKLIWPSHLLSFTYPIGHGLSLDQVPVVKSALAVVMITVVTTIERRRVPILIAAWAAYAMLVLPVSGLVPPGDQQVVAQRYAYVAILPLLVAAAGAALLAWRRLTMAARTAFIGLAAVQLCVFGASARSLIAVWHDQETRTRVDLAENPDSEPLNRGFAMWLLDQGRVPEALAYAQRDVEIAPEFWPAHSTLGLVLGRLGRPQEALAQAEEALRMNPHSAGAHYSFGWALMDLGKVPEAMAQYEAVLRLKPDDWQANLNLGVALQRLGRTSDAIRRYEASLRVYPDDVDAQLDLGAALFAEGRAQDAIMHYREALRLKPDSADAYFNLGRVMEELGILPDAATDYEQVLRIRPDRVKAHLQLGAILERLGRTDDAIQHYQKALEITPDYVEAHYRLAGALERSGRADKAIEQYEEVLRADPAKFEAYVNLGNACLQIGDVPGAMAEYEAALRVSPDVAEAHSNLGAIYQRQGRLSEAVAQYEQALRIKPDYVDAHFNLGLALEKLGRTPEAMEHYQQALKLRPDFAPAKDALS